MSDKDNGVKPVNTNNVVDVSAPVTNSSNSNHRPTSKTEFQVAVKALVDKFDDDKMPGLYDDIVKIVDTRIKKDEQMNKKVEEAIRAHVRKVIKEIAPRMDWSFSGTDYGDGDDEKDYKRRKNQTVGDVEGKKFEDLAKQLGISVRSAKNAVERTIDKMKWLMDYMSEDPDQLNMVILETMVEYIEYLKSSGELTDEDVELLQNNVEIVKDLDGFRDYLYQVVDSAFVATGGRKMDVFDPSQEKPIDLPAVDVDDEEPPSVPAPKKKTAAEEEEEEEEERINTYLDMLRKKDLAQSYLAA